MSRAVMRSAIGAAAVVVGAAVPVTAVLRGAGACTIAGSAPVDLVRGSGVGSGTLWARADAAVNTPQAIVTTMMPAPRPNRAAISLSPYAVAYARDWAKLLPVAYGGFAAAPFRLKGQAADSQ